MTNTTVNPATLTPEQMAQLLTAAGGQTVTPEAIREDLAAGAPANADGTMSLLEYAAWLAQNIGSG